MSSREQKVTVPRFVAMKSSGRKICMITAYDYPTARLADATGVDAILVGDSLGMVVQGHGTTLPVTLDQMLYHAEMVGRAVQHALVVVDMPFPTFHLGKYQAVENAAKVLKQTACHAVKLEGGAHQAETIEALVQAGIPVMAHCGLRPQSVRQLGNFSVQRDRETLLADARAAQEAGAFSVLLECVPGDLAAEVTAAVKVPTIGIGAGPGCDGQILVFHDVVGLPGERTPRHAKRYADLGTVISEALNRYRDEVHDGRFPGPEQTFQ